MTKTEAQTVRIKVVDSSEPWEIREKLLETGWETRGLYSADYWFFTHDFKKVGIERKTVSDLLTGLGQRLSNQLEKMAEHYDYKILLLEGSWKSVASRVVTSLGVSRWLMSTVWNFIRSWQDRGVTLELTANTNHTIRRLNELYAYYQKPYHTGGVNRNTFSDDRVLAFPTGCRGKTGLKVLEGRCLLDVACMSPESLQKIEGIGKSKANSIYDHFHRIGGNNEVQKSVHKKEDKSTG